MTSSNMCDVMDSVTVDVISHLYDVTSSLTWLRHITEHLTISYLTNLSHLYDVTSDVIEHLTTSYPT